MPIFLNNVGNLNRNLCIFQIMNNIRLLFSLLFIYCILFYFDSASANTCRNGKKPIHFAVNTTLQKNIPSDFTNSILGELKPSLNEIGYCLEPIDSSALRDSSRADELVIYLTAQSEAAQNLKSASSFTLLVCLVRTEDWANGNLDIPLDHPLITITYQPEELSTFESILVKKIIENIRTQYVCHLKLQSNPSGVAITTSTGLEGKTPLEWILPVGDLTIYSNLKGYENYHKKLEFTEPGIHTYFLELKKKQFFNSKFLYPTIAFALASAVCYGYDRYYYSEYLKLGKENYYNQPEQFGNTYNKALNFERASLITLACTAVSFTFTFVFK